MQRELIGIAPDAFRASAREDVVQDVVQSPRPSRLGKALGAGVAVLTVIAPAACSSDAPDSISRQNRPPAEAVPSATSSTLESDPETTAAPATNGPESLVTDDLVEGVRRTRASRAYDGPHVSVSVEKGIIDRLGSDRGEEEGLIITEHVDMGKIPDLPESATNRIKQSVVRIDAVTQEGEPIPTVSGYVVESSLTSTGKAVVTSGTAGLDMLALGEGNVTVTTAYGEPVEIDLKSGSVLSSQQTINLGDGSTETSLTESHAIFGITQFPEGLSAIEASTRNLEDLKHSEQVYIHGGDLDNDGNPSIIRGVLGGRSVVGFDPTEFYSATTDATRLVAEDLMPAGSVVVDRHGDLIGFVEGITDRNRRGELLVDCGEQFVIGSSIDPVTLGATGIDGASGEAVLFEEYQEISGDNCPGLTVAAVNIVLRPA